MNFTLLTSLNVLSWVDTFSCRKVVFTGFQLKIIEDEVTKEICRAESHIINSCCSNDETGDHLRCETIGEIDCPAVNYLFMIFLYTV